MQQSGSAFPDASGLTSPSEVYAATAGLKSTNKYNSDVCLNFKILEPWQKLELLKCFADSNSVSYLSQLLTGLEKVGGKGITHGRDRVSSVRSKHAYISSRYKVCLDEKRNYWAFVMSVVAIVTFPFSVMTGFFGASSNTVVLSR